MLRETVRTEEQYRLIDEMMGSHYADEQSRSQFIRAATIKCRRDQLLGIMRSFDAFCETRGIRYFVFSNTLRGVISYGDFLPKSSSIDLGMLRSDYDRFEIAYKHGEAEKLRWELQTNYEGKLRGVRRLRPLLKTKEPALVSYDGCYLYDNDSMPIQVYGTIKITIFDEVPDDFFMRKKFFRQMKRRNDLVKDSLGAHDYLTGKPDEQFDPSGRLMKFRSMNLWRALYRRLIPPRFATWLNWTKAQKYQGTGAENVTSVMFGRSKTCPVNDLGDMPYRDFAGIKVRTPARPDLWAKKPIMETTPELARLQTDAKIIVKEIDRVCRVLGIEYFACGGTMLGYVRHGGFIPWDDDIDVGMLRADYERFKAEAGAVIDSERFFLQTRATDPNIPYLFSKVRMNGTEYLTDYNIDRDFHKGICVDVFPFDYIPNDSVEQREFRAQVREVEKHHNYIVNRQYPMEKAKCPKKNLDWLIAQTNGRLLCRYYWSISLDDTQAAYDEIATTYDREENAAERYEFVASFVPTYTMARVADLKPYQRVNFDGIELYIPAKPELFLSMQYGDYMTLPYPHQCTGHDLLLWSDEQGVGGGRLTGEEGFSGEEDNTGEEDIAE